MAMTVQYARKVGGSLMVRIPKDIVKIEQIDEGETLEVEIRKLKKDCFGILSGLKPFAKTEKLDIHG